MIIFTLRSIFLLYEDRELLFSIAYAGFLLLS
jgi:hypothetical protein